MRRRSLPQKGQASLVGIGLNFFSTPGRMHHTGVQGWLGIYAACSVLCWWLPQIHIGLKWFRNRHRRILPIRDDWVIGFCGGQKASRCFALGNRPNGHSNNHIIQFIFICLLSIFYQFRLFYFFIIFFS